MVTIEDEAFQNTRFRTKYQVLSTYFCLFLYNQITNTGSSWASISHLFFFFSSRRRHTRFKCDWSSDVGSSDLVPIATVHMPVDAVVANVELAADVPLRVRRLPLVQLLPGFKPRDAAGGLGPELIETLVVYVWLSICLFGELGRRRAAPRLHLHRFDGMALTVAHPSPPLVTGPS